MARLNNLAVICLVLIQRAVYVHSLTIDPSGYIIFCPCMGRLGNQMDYFLGSLRFAKELNRTLILPPWIDYSAKSGPNFDKTTIVQSDFIYNQISQISFEDIFDINVVQRYHRVIVAREFMSNFANHVWPLGRRAVFCFRFHDDDDSHHGSCAPTQGSPAREFWHFLQIQFAESLQFSPLTFDVDKDPSLGVKWHDSFAPSAWPVIAFVGSPASYPVSRHNVELQKYFAPSRSIRDFVGTFVRESGMHAWIGIHLRLGTDWKSACTHAHWSPKFLSLSQCVEADEFSQIKESKQNANRGELNERARTMCWPTVNQMRRQLDETVAFAASANYNLTHLYVASDVGEDHASIFEIIGGDSTVANLKVVSARDVKKFIGRQQKMNLSASFVGAQLDAAILVQAKIFVGNCASSFSAFISRTRQYGCDESQDHGTTFYWNHWKLKRDSIEKISHTDEL